jgi:hypothetical protein
MQNRFNITNGISRAIKAAREGDIELLFEDDVERRWVFVNAAGSGSR